MPDERAGRQKMSVMDAMDDLLTAIDGLQATVNKTAPKRDDKLLWEVFHETKHSVLPFGWTLHLGYSIDREPGDAPAVWIHRAYLDTGVGEHELSLKDIDVNALEDDIRQIVEDQDEADAEAHAPDDGDFGEFLMNARKDRES